MSTLEAQLEKAYPSGPDSAGFELSVTFTAGDEITVLFGPSGAGKTLTLESIAGFVRPDSGYVRLAGETLFDSDRGSFLPARRRHCGYVFQKDALFPHMSLRRNLEFAAADLKPLQRERRILQVLESFRLGTLAGRRPHELSGGERQRGAIARTLVNQPRLLLLDEPARGLDVGLRRQLYDILRQIRSEYRLPMLLVTHNLEEAFELGDRMLVYRQGRIVQQGPPREVYERPASTAVAELLGLSDVTEAVVAELDPGNNRTRLQAGELRILTPYLPGRSAGDRVQLCIRPERVIAAPSNGAVEQQRLALPLTDVIEMPDQVRLVFPGALSAYVSRALYEKGKSALRWTLEFPPDAVWVFPQQGEADS